jgi:hypothetical protein
LNFKTVSAEEIENGKSKRGQFTRRQLADWGVSWPPAKGWQQRLMRGDDPNNPTRDYKGKHQHAFVKQSDHIADLFQQMTAEQQAETIGFMERLVKSPR